MGRKDDGVLEGCLRSVLWDLEGMDFGVGIVQITDRGSKYRESRAFSGVTAVKLCGCAKIVIPLDRPDSSYWGSQGIRTH